MDLWSSVILANVTNGVVTLDGMIVSPSLSLPSLRSLPCCILYYQQQFIYSFATRKRERERDRESERGGGAALLLGNTILGQGGRVEF